MGDAFLSYMRRRLRQSTFEEDDALVKQRLDEHVAANTQVDELDNDIGEEPESQELLDSDPMQWKSLDHYAVLGLSSRRYKATDYEIKIAHRKKVLKHHPDKKVSATGVSDDAFFKCVAKSFEILSNPEKRRQFDSVDEGVDDDNVPTGKESPERFYELWAPVFEREARFSKQTPVPSLGTKDSTKEEVDDFYNFFYNFDSWRSFEYLDSEVNEGSDNRDEKRYTEKKNLKKEKKTIRNIITGANYFQPEGTTPSASVLDKQLTALDALCASLEPEQVLSLREACEKSTAEAKAALHKACEEKSLGDAFA